MLRGLHRRFAHSFVTRDAASHGALLHPSFLAVTRGGAVVERTHYLRHQACAFDPEAVPYRDLRDERITVLGDIALVSGTNHWVRVVDARKRCGMTCYTDTYVRDHGTWLCVLAQLTAQAPEPHPDDATIFMLYRHGVRQPLRPATSPDGWA